MPLPHPGRAARRADEAGSTVRGAALLAVSALVVVALAFLWPVGLGGCTSLLVVPPGAAGTGLVSGDVVVTRCSAPGVGDRVVDVGRAGGPTWAVGRVVAEQHPAVRVRGADGVERATPADALDVLPLQVSVASVRPVVGGALLTLAVVAGWFLRRRLRATRTAARAGSAAPAA